MELSAQTKKSCLIIGGGITGLVAGTVLQQHGIAVTILDKGRGIGGRLATRRISHPLYGVGVFDYGMQAFSVSDPRFRCWVDELLEQGIISAWQGLPNAAEMTSYRGVNSSRSIAQHLAKDLEIRTQTCAVEITRAASAWEVRAENGDRFQGDDLLITAPIPQTLALLDNSEIDLPTDIRTRLESVVYQPCIAMLALLDRPSAVPAPGGLRIEDPVLSWIACNQQKGISPQAAAITVHATPEFSRTHWEADEATIAAILLDRAAHWLGAKAIDFQIHRWGYSQPQTCYGAPFVALTKSGIIAIAGDAFSANIVGDPTLNLEGAVLSGLAVAERLISAIA